MAGPTVSVVIANYNHARFLRRSVAAILEQEPPPLEIVIIDDGSTDDSAAVIGELAAGHPLIRSLANPVNLGVIATINRGLAEARGDFVLFAAADDWILPGLLARSLALLRAHPQAGLCSGPTFVSNEAGDDLRILPSSVPSTRPAYLSPERADALFVRDESWCIGTSALVNRIAALELGGFRAELGSSCDDFLYRQLSLRHGACFAPEPLSVFRRVDGGYSSATFANVTAMVSIMTATLFLMRGEFRALFSEAHVTRWRSRWLYAILLGAARPGQVRGAELGDLWPEAGRFDRALLHFARRGWIGRRLFAILLFMRLRLRDAPQVVWRRVWWTLKGYRQARFFR